MHRDWTERECPFSPSTSAGAGNASAFRSSFSCLSTPSNETLSAIVPRLASAECGATSSLVAALAEMDARKLYVREGYSSLFAYCTTRLRLSEAAACRRIEAARASRPFPLILERLARCGARCGPAAADGVNS